MNHATLDNGSPVILTQTFTDDAGNRHPLANFSVMDRASKLALSPAVYEVERSGPLNPSAGHKLVGPSLTLDGDHVDGAFAQVVMTPAEIEAELDLREGKFTADEVTMHHLHMQALYVVAKQAVPSLTQAQFWNAIGPVFTDPAHADHITRSNFTQTMLRDII